MCFDLFATFLDAVFVTCTVYNSCIVFSNCNFVSSTQHFDGSLFQFQTFFFADNNTTCQDSDIFQHFFTTVTEARSFHSTDLQLRTQTVYYQCSQRFAIYIFCNYQQRTTSLYSRFEDRQEIFQVRNLLVIDQDVRFLHLTFHLFRICHEVSRQITTVELHTFYYTDSSVCSFCFFDSNHTVFRNFTHSVSNQFTDYRIVVCRYSGNLFNLVIVVTYSFSLILD